MAIVFLAQKEGFDLRCGAGRVAALTCRRHVIHYRGAAPLPPAGEGFGGCFQTYFTTSAIAFEAAWFFEGTQSGAG